MTREPQQLGVSLSKLISRFTRVDLPIMDVIHERWPSLVGDEVASRCRPQVVKDGVLIVAVPTGAFATRLTRDAPDILDALADLGARCPRELRTVVQGNNQPL
jgi:predicted nucleic acid-binding Zn ribbon protein